MEIIKSHYRKIYNGIQESLCQHNSNVNHIQIIIKLITIITINDGRLVVVDQNYTNLCQENR